MSNINTQYTFDNKGKPIGVFLPVEDWNAITKELQINLPQWQTDMIDMRLEQYKNNPADVMDWDTVNEQFEREDEAV